MLLFNVNQKTIHYAVYRILQTNNISDEQVKTYFSVFIRQSLWTQVVNQIIYVKKQMGFGGTDLKQVVKQKL